MQKSLLYFQFNRLSSQYRKFKYRLDKALKENRFKDYSQQKQMEILTRLEKLKTRLAGMQQALKFSGSALTLGFALYNGEVQAQAPKAVGAEFLVNTYTTSEQKEPSIAMDSHGNFVITYESWVLDGTGYSIYAQRYNAAGEAQGGEFLVNTSELLINIKDQKNPSIAMDSDGDFVIAWQDDSFNLYARRFNAAGTPQGDEFQVDTYSNGYTINPCVAMDNNGDFVIAWQSYGQDGNRTGIYTRRYNAEGTPQGAEFLVNTNTTNWQKNPSVAMDDNGNFVIAWDSWYQDGDQSGIYGQRFNADGQAQGVEFLVNTYTKYSQREPSVAINGNGDFVIAWHSEIQDGWGNGIYAQRFNSTGQAQGLEFQVSDFNRADQKSPCIDIDSDGDFVISWQSIDQDGSGSGIYAQSYNAAGKAQGTEFRVNSFTTNNQLNPSVAIDSDGDFVVTWDSEIQDGEKNGIYAQRYTASIPLGISPDAAISTNQINVYPNPSTGAFNIDAVGKFLDEYTVTIIDALGAMVYKGIYTEQLSLDHLPKGLYNLRLENENDVIVKQIVIE